MAVALNLVLHAVILCVDAGSQYKHTIGQLGFVLLTAAQQRILVLYVAAIFPQLAKTGVVYDLHLGCIANGFKEFQHDRLPRCPLAHKGVQPKAADAVVVGGRVVRHPLGRGAFHGVFIADAPASGADIPDISDLVCFLIVHNTGFGFIAYVFPLDFVVLLAMRAAAHPALHGAFGVAFCDNA